MRRGTVKVMESSLYKISNLRNTTQHKMNFVKYDSIFGFIKELWIKLTH